MLSDAECKNSSGYFKDPITGEDLSVDSVRVIPASLDNGKFVWPCVARSDGEQLLKIVYKYFTAEEKDLYKQYRGRPSGTGHSQVKREPKAKVEKQKPVTEEPAQVIKYDPDSAATIKTLETLAMCDRLFGVSQISGITYVACGAYGSNVVYHIPRSLVPDEEFERLNGGMA